jgi:hypothetical protein
MEGLRDALFYTILGIVVGIFATLLVFDSCLVTRSSVYLVDKTVLEKIDASEKANK